ncbi:MAG: LTA synthase family protein [Oscillospiraceae bacterium]|nr:LTA synthase family protein [Oscillospiraceae bacterium]
MHPAVRKVLVYLKNLLLLAGAYFLTECLAALLLKPESLNGLAFGALWALLFAAVCLALPRLAGRIVFGISYYVTLLWSLAQVAYYSVFSRMMWFTDIGYAGEGAPFIWDVIGMFPVLWWIGGLLLLAVGGLLIWKFPKNQALPWKLSYLSFGAAAIIALLFLPEAVFLRDNDVWGTRSEYGQSSSWRAAYNTMYDAKKLYDICGVYHLTARDIWVHGLYPLTPAYRSELQSQRKELDAYFVARGEKEDNEMTGAFAGKNVVLVLMESMDDWMITQEDTPTLHRMMAEGVNFTNFYTPGYGTARTINSEFCVNTGIYLPTNGNYVFNYVTNTFDQSIASQLTANGYSAEVFHYNDGSFYSRDVFEEAMGYNTYNSYAAYTDDENALYDDNLLFDIPELRNLFFREGQTFNTIITRSAHLSYKYNEVLSHYALKKHPEYRGKYGSEEEDCARLKAKLVDDMFARLLQELEAAGQLENTVIIGVTDHYTYGYKNMEELYAHSGVEDTLLLEKTPCFVWSADCKAQTVSKTLNTADFLPTMLNLLGIRSPYSYLGQDAFDPDYQGYALFPDGSWICGGVVYKATGKIGTVLENNSENPVTEEHLQQMNEKVMEFIRMSNLLLTSDYYRK